MQSFHSVEEVEETSKALELPDLHDEDSGYGSDFESRQKMLSVSLTMSL